MYTGMIDWNSERVHEAADQLLISEIVPAVRAAIAAAAPKLVTYPDNPFEHYAAAELLIKSLADLLTLSDTEELDRLTPSMLADDQYTTYWIEKLS